MRMPMGPPADASGGSSLRSPVRDLAVALSLANLILLRLWKDNFALLAASNQYFLEEPPRPMRFLAVSAAVVVLGLAFFVAARLRDAGWARGATTLGFWAAAGYAANLCRLEVPWLRGGSTAAGLRAVALLALLGIGAWWLARRCGGPRRLAYLALLMATPFTGLNLGRGLLAVATYPRAKAALEAPAAPPRPAEKPPARRLVFLLFDELDFEQTFARRPLELDLPQLDRLRREAWSAESAYPQSNWTRASVPALLSGQEVFDARPAGPADLRLSLADREVSWRDLPSLFSRARALGVSSAITGNYHPYCRLFGDQVAQCHAHSDYPEPRNWAELAGAYHQNLVHGVPGARWLGLDRFTRHYGRKHVERRASMYGSIHCEAVTLVGRAELGLVFAHYPIPHWPPIYLRDSRTLGPGGSYLDNLALVDRSIGEIRAALQAAGLADRTALLVTADHAHRREGPEKGDVDVGNPAHRVPFLLYLPGGSPGVIHRELVRGAATFDVAVAFLAGEVQAHADVSRMLSKSRRR
jgi:hypothetical protein